MCSLPFSLSADFTSSLVSLHYSHFGFFHNESEKCLKITVLVIDAEGTLIPHHFMPSLKSGKLSLLWFGPHHVLMDCCNNGPSPLTNFFLRPLPCPSLFSTLLNFL